MLFSKIHELIVVDISYCNELNILSVVVVSMEVFNIIKRQVLKGVSVSSNRLSHHMFSVSVEMDVFHQSSF